MKILGFIILFLCGHSATILAWNDDYDTQTIRGKIFDQATQAPLADVLVELQNYYPRKTTRTDSEGRFKLIGVPLGRHKLLMTKEGYDDLMVPGFEVTAGRQSILSLPMHKRRKSKDEEIDETIIAQKLENNLVLTNKDYPLDEMSTGTFRVLDVEEINRFAGDQLDPARLAGNYAGIFTQNDWYNGEVIRGNSPYFMQWRLEDLPINNPNQLGRIGTTGGEYNALNPNILSNSDIIMTTTAPHYGNSIAGVFDARLRSGSLQKIEGIVGYNTLQGGVFLLEGPLNRKKKPSSFLFSVRAKPANALNSLATRLTNRNQIFIQNASTIYDLALKISLPKTSIGALDFFAVGGFGRVNRFGTDLNKAGRDQFVIRNLDEGIMTTNGTVGIKHQVYIGADKSLYWKTVLGGSDFRRFHNAISADGDSIVRLRNNHSSLLLVSYVNKHFSEDFSIRGGVNYRYDIHQIRQNYYTRSDWSHFYNGGAHLIQGFIQAHYTPNRAWTITGGATACLFSFNNFYDFDYRLNIRYKPHNRHQ
ncbi:MAG: carboxypeptidase-like regulatory domain-containing protein, partial [Saprospiraceae bacterium]|nr:carboxypeptidase-like regulatory domain-containing protein [Saprospiraceae bacterium]